MNKENKIVIKDYIKSAIKSYEFKINNKCLQENIIALEELKLKNNETFGSLILNSQNAKITALGIIKLSNKGLIFNKDFNIIPFKNKLTTIINSGVYQKRMQDNNWIVKKSVIFKDEKFEWDSIRQLPKNHEINFDIDTSKLENIIGAYAFGINQITKEEKGILIRKSDIKRWKEASPSGKSDYSPWNKWPKEMVEAKLYRKLAQELGIDISDIDLDEKIIKDDGNLEYVSFKEIDNVKKEIKVTNQDPFENAQEIIDNFNEARNEEITQEHINNINEIKKSNNLTDLEKQAEEIDNLELELD